MIKECKSECGMYNDLRFAVRGFSERVKNQLHSMRRKFIIQFCVCE